MKYEIKNSWSGEVIFADEAVSFSALILAAIKAGANLRYANLRYANLRYANLRYANLSGANLSDANLRSANLGYANLRSANLGYANLRSADLHGANLSYANLSGANLSDANLRSANLSDANLSYADLRSANLSGANLSDANLRSAKNVPALASAQSLIVPESGAFEGWKKCRDNVIVQVQISKDAARSNATGRKCRAEKVKVLEVFGAKEGVSQHKESTVYKKGKTVKCDRWNEDRWVECGGGIHFFLTRVEAEAY